jgi:co-chaperonin GroES (HSP10)
MIPRNEYVLVELDKKPEAAAPGRDFRLDSDSVKDRQRATVLKTGPGRLTSSGQRVDIDLPEGTRVWLFPGAGQKVNDNEDLLLIKDELILGVIDEDGI